MLVRIQLVGLLEQRWLDMSIGVTMMFYCWICLQTSRRRMIAWWTSITFTLPRWSQTIRVLNAISRFLLLASWVCVWCVLWPERELLVAKRSCISCVLTQRWSHSFQHPNSVSGDNQSCVWKKGFMHISYISGQIIATSHDLTPNGGLVREIPLFQGNLSWWNIFYLISSRGRIIWKLLLLIRLFKDFQEPVIGCINRRGFFCFHFPPKIRQFPSKDMAFGAIQQGYLVGLDWSTAIKLILGVIKRCVGMIT